MTRPPLNPADWRSIDQVATQIMVETGGLRLIAWGQDYVLFKRTGEGCAYRLSEVGREMKGKPKKADFLHLLELLRGGAKLDRVPLPDLLR